MKKQLVIGAIALASYINSPVIQAQQSVELNTSLSEIERTVDLLYELGTPVPITTLDSLGTRYSYESTKPIYLDGEKYDKTFIAYVDYTNESDRISITMIDKGYKTDIKVFFDGLSGPIDGIPEKGVSEDYTLGPALRIKSEFENGNLMPFGDDLKLITSQKQLNWYHSIIDQFLEHHKKHRLKIEYHNYEHDTINSLVEQNKFITQTRQ